MVWDAEAGLTRHPGMDILKTHRQGFRTRLRAIMICYMLTGSTSFSRHASRLVGNPGRA